ncbi:unnamed protein product [Protopolystoma xenopodis]|uniref:Uncharacterized protein n=1 Tax=Protopolystoma xenopodis TaxID=117903 RepID=A0A3S5B810_9PLAT|nr:unnamed protein product [Protopolystoma xenopodis]
MNPNENKLNSSALEKDPISVQLNGADVHSLSLSVFLSVYSSVCPPLSGHLSVQQGLENCRPDLFPTQSVTFES